MLARLSVADSKFQQMRHIFLFRFPVQQATFQDAPNLLPNDWGRSVQLLWEQTDFDFTVGQCLCGKGPDPLSDAVVRQWHKTYSCYGIK